MYVRVECIDFNNFGNWWPVQRCQIFTSKTHFSIFWAVFGRVGFKVWNKGYKGQTKFFLTVTNFREGIKICRFLRWFRNRWKKLQKSLPPNIINKIVKENSRFSIFVHKNSSVIGSWVKHFFTFSTDFQSARNFVFLETILDIYQKYLTNVLFAFFTSFEAM